MRTPRQARPFRSYDFPNAEIRVYPDRRCREFPKWCPMIHVERARSDVAQALRALRILRRTGSLPPALVAAPPVATAPADADDDGDNETQFRNVYECPCGATWEDVWSCACNDRCPSCNREIEPSESVEVEA